VLRLNTYSGQAERIKGEDMRQTKLRAIVVVVALLGGAAGSCGRAESQIPGPDAPAAKTEILARGAAPDEISGRFNIKAGDVSKSVDIEDLSEVVVTKNTLGPGASVGWHSHPGPAIVTIVSGELTYVRASDCARFTYGKGKSFVDPGHGNVHIGFNASDSQDTVLYATYLEVPAGQSPRIAAEAPDC
jgi:quercetin dioxygenase-like cupin family protein